MTSCLIALGSNLGDRDLQLNQAIFQLALLPQTQLISRSAWYETPPVGGPTGQRPFLNGAVRIDTALEPASVHRRLLQIENDAGRVRRERWAQRTLDLDLLLFGNRQLNEPDLLIPHPRMTYRRFVLQGAAEVAAWMRHPSCGWTVGGLLRHLDSAPDVVAIATDDVARGQGLASRLANYFQSPLEIGPLEKVAARQDQPAGFPAVALSRPGDAQLSGAKLVLLLSAKSEIHGGRDQPAWDKLPTAARCGPLARLGAHDAEDALTEAAAAVTAVWPDLHPTSESSA